MAGPAPTAFRLSLRDSSPLTRNRTSSGRPRVVAGGRADAGDFHPAHALLVALTHSWCCALQEIDARRLQKLQARSTPRSVDPLEITDEARRKHSRSEKRRQLDNWLLSRCAIQTSRRRDCHFADVPSTSLLKHLLKGEGCSRMTISPTANPNTPAHSLEQPVDPARFCANHAQFDHNPSWLGPSCWRAVHICCVDYDHSPPMLKTWNPPGCAPAASHPSGLPRTLQVLECGGDRRALTAHRVLQRARRRHQRHALRVLLRPRKHPVSGGPVGGRVATAGRVRWLRFRGQEGFLPSILRPLVPMLPALSTSAPRAAAFYPLPGPSGALPGAMKFASRL